MMNATRLKSKNASPLPGALRRCFFVRTESHKKGRRESLFDESVAVAHE